MNLYDFKAQINDTESGEEADELCLQWLKDKAENHQKYMDTGNEGRAALLLLQAYEMLTS